MTDEDDNNHPWARSSLIIQSDGLSIDEIGREMGQPTAGKKAKDRWIAHLEPSSRVRLEEQLPAVERFLGDKITVLEKLAATCEIYLHLGWAPEAGQDHVVFGSTLIGQLGRLGAEVALDTYTGCEFCNPGGEPSVAPGVNLYTQSPGQDEPAVWPGVGSGPYSSSSTVAR